MAVVNVDDGAGRAKGGGLGIEPLTIAVTMGARARGLLGTRSFSGMLLLAPCGSVHTFGMAYPIDIAFVGRSGEVLRSARAVGPNRLMRCRKAAMTIERQHDPCAGWFSQGDTIALISAE